MKRKRKQYLVIGLGRFGSSVARTLSQMGHEVLAVDMDEVRVSEIADDVVHAVQADVTEDGVMKALGADGFDRAIVCIGENSRNSILVTVLCKEAGIPLVIAKAEDDLHARILIKIGADRVVRPERDMGQRLARTLEQPNILEMLELAPDYRIAEVCVPAMWKGRTLKEIDVRRQYGITVAGIRRGASFLPSPGADTRLSEDDVLLVLGTTHSIEAL